jgi:CheY-like chemotaxis protein
MDDDEMVRNMVYHCLTSLGYEAVLAEDGEAAEALYGAALEAGDPFAAVILDLIVPDGAGGIETVRALRELDPDVRAIFISGGRSDATDLPDDPAQGAPALLLKPCSIAQLDRTLKRVTGRSGGAAE